MASESAKRLKLAFVRLFKRGSSLVRLALRSKSDMDESLSSRSLELLQSIQALFALIAFNHAKYFYNPKALGVTEKP